MCQMCDVVLFLIPKKTSHHVLHHCCIRWEEWHSEKLHTLLNLVPDVQHFTVVTLAESLFYWLCPQLDYVSTTKNKKQNKPNKEKDPKPKNENPKKTSRPKPPPRQKNKNNSKPNTTLKLRLTSRTSSITRIWNMVWPDFWSVLVLRLTTKHQFGFHFLVPPDAAYPATHKHILCSNI